MSSIIEAAATASAVHTNGSQQVIHFDATNRRKQKMRDRATAAPGSNGHETAPAPAAPATPVAPAAAIQPAPVAVQPVAVQPAAPPLQPAPAPQLVAEAQPAAMSGSSLSGEELESFLINFVVEQTGYPPEMVEMDADLEADLGIDSIKKAQLFGELAEYFDVDVESAEDLSLDDFPTLRHVMDFLAGQSGAPATAAQPEPAMHAAAPATPPPVPVQPAATPAPAAQVAADETAATSNLSGAELETFLVNFVVEQTGYPPEMVEMDADLEADLGIDSIKKAQLFGELAEYFDIDVKSAEDLSLDDFPTLRHVMDFLSNANAGSTDTAPAPTNHHANGNGAVKAAAPVAAPTAIAPVAPAIQPAPVAIQPATIQPATIQPAVIQPAQPQSAAPQPVAVSPQPAPQPSAHGTSANGHGQASLSSAELETFLINFVVEQTGYPPEMVEMDADLEADLGIDSIKKAQLFGELAEYFDVDVKSAEDLSLDDFPTLRHVMEFLQNVSRKAAV